MRKRIKEKKVMRMDVNDLNLSIAILEIREIRKMVDQLIYERMLIKCPECDSINVVVLKTTNKMVFCVCKECGKTFRKTKKKVEETHKELSKQFLEKVE